jgi:hypothetical protein
MYLYDTICHRFTSARTRAALVIALTSALVTSCGTLVCMDGPCDAVVAGIYSKSLFVPNRFSESRSTEETAADIWECKAEGQVEQSRLLAELRAFDPWLAEYAARRAKIEGVGQSAGRTAANTDVDTSGSGVRVSGGGSSTDFEEDVGGALGSIAASVLLDDGYDPAKQPLIDLESYLASDDVFVRFTEMCLREKGYELTEKAANADDGPGMVNMDPEQLAVTIRRNDCVDVAMYKKYPVRDDNGDYVFKKSKLVYSDAELPVPVRVADCDPAALQAATAAAAAAAAAAVAAAGVPSWPTTDLPEPLAGINTRSALEEYLEVESACVWSRPGYEVCSWRELGKRNKLYMRPKSYKSLSGHIDTDELVNVVCELSKDDPISTPDSCQIFPRETKGKPNMKDGASEAALANIHAINGIGAISRLVGDGPGNCKTVADGVQECSWYLDKEVQGFKLVGTVAKTKKPVELDCRFSLEDGASLPGSCSAARYRK